MIVGNPYLEEFNKYEDYTVDLKDDDNWAGPVTVTLYDLFEMFKAKMKEDEENGDGIE